MTHHARPARWFDADYYYGTGKSLLQGGMGIDSTLALKARIVQEALPENPLLDVGCGLGMLVNRLCMQGRTAYGIDWSPVVPSLRLSPFCYQADASRLPFADRSMGGVCSFDLLEHLPLAQIPQVLREIIRVGREFFLWISCSLDRNLGDISAWPGQDRSHVSFYTPIWWCKQCAEVLPPERTQIHIASFPTLIEQGEVLGGCLIWSRPDGPGPAWEELAARERRQFQLRFGVSRA